VQHQQVLLLLLQARDACRVLGVQQQGVGPRQAGLQVQQQL
jgi:hypothetical protein